METLFLKTGSNSRVELHPVVLFTAIDHYLRREKDQERVIGTLLGIENDSGVIEVTSCFPVPHKEIGDGEVAVGKDFNRQMLALHQKVNPKEKVVGWYATAVGGKLVTKESCLIHDFYGQVCQNPVHLVIDTALTNNTLAVNAYHSSPLRIGDKSIAAQFQQIPVKITSDEPERIGLDAMLDSVSPVEAKAQIVTDRTDSLEKSVENLLAMLNSTCQFVDDVVAGRRVKNREVGRMIAEMMSAVPHIKAGEFQNMFDSSVQDLLMVSYLSNLTRTQLAAAEKICLSAH